jgi:hypothetical protein
VTGPTARVRTGLPELLAQVAAAFRLGDVRDWSVLTTGYEDCNIDLTTSMTRVVVKIFAANRPPGSPSGPPISSGTPAPPVSTTPVCLTPAARPCRSCAGIG